MARPTPKTGNRKVDMVTGLEGQQPIDTENVEVLPRAGGTAGYDKGLVLSAPGGSVVRATHAGRVGLVRKESDGTFIVDVVATDSILDLETRMETPFTRYSALGNIEVVFGQAVGIGQQIGTVAFFANSSAGGGTGLKYQVFANGSGSKASELDPRTISGKQIIRNAQKSGEPPTEENKKVPPEEAADGDPPLNPLAGNTADVSNIETTNAPYFSRPQVRFVEQKNQVFSHDFLVFINGVDVTSYVTGTLTINIVDKDGWNEANLVLNNAANNFVITLENLGVNEDLRGKFRTNGAIGEEKYSEKAKAEIIAYKNDKDRNPFVDISTMGLIQAGFTSGVQDAAPTGREEQLAGVQTGGGGVSTSAVGSRRDRRSDKLSTAASGLVDRRWQLGFQSTVFHKHDPIRIFRKNPIREADEWMPAFTGYLNEISYDTNYINGLATVKLSCYDIRALAQKMRVQTTAVTGVTNPRSIFRGEEAAGSRALFTDLLDPTIVGSPLAGKRFEEVMEFLITGTTSEDTSITDAFGSSKFKRGIGEFTLGDKILYASGSGDKEILPDPLEHWHHLCLFGMDGRLRRRGKDKVNVTDGSAKVETLSTAFNRRWLTRAEAVKIGKATTHDGEWSPHSQFVHFLLPAEGTGAKNLIDFDVVNANSNQLDFRTRLDILQDFANRIDYQFWVTPMGDFVVEFPMYDFLPQDFQEFKTVFQVDKHLRTDNIQDEAGDMTTTIIAHGRLRAERDANVGVDKFQPKAIVIAPMMMMRYGVIEHELTLPFITNPDSLARLAQIEFQKRLAASNKMDIEFDYRPFILPNRPIEHMERKRMGLTTAVRNELVVFKQASTSISTRYIRRQIFRNDGKAAYTFIFSGSSMPISYREIYEPGTIDPVSGDSTSAVTLAVTSLTGNGAGNSSSGAVSPEPIKTPESTLALEMATRAATPARSPTPSTAQVGKFLAVGQVSSGWNPANRGADGKLGLFGLDKGFRDFSGIGDSLNIEEQITAADIQFRGLVDKFNGNLEEAVAEFWLGVDKVKNLELKKEFQEGTGAVIDALGKKFEEAAQPLVDGWKKLFPGEEEKGEDEEKEKENKNRNDSIGDESKKALAEAETNGPLSSTSGFQGNVGVLVFDNRNENPNQSVRVDSKGAGAVSTPEANKKEIEIRDDRVRRINDSSLA